MKTTDSGFFLPWVSWLAQLPYITQMTLSIVGWALLHPLAIKKMHKTWPQINHTEAIPHQVSFFWVCQVDKIKSHTRIFTASVLSEAHQVWDPGSLPKLFFYFYWSICLWLCLFFPAAIYALGLHFMEAFCFQISSQHLPSDASLLAREHSSRWISAPITQPPPLQGRGILMYYVESLIILSPARIRKHLK